MFRTQTSTPRVQARKVVLFIASSLDGYIAGSDGNVEWLFHDADYGTSPFLQSVDTVFIGRKTHEVMCRLGMPSYASKKNFVFTRNPPSNGHTEIEYTSERPGELVRRLREQSGANMWLVGGAELTAAFLADGVLDEFALSIHPIILGDGIPLFLPSRASVNLKLMDCRKYDSGLVQLRYGVRRSES